MNMVNVMLGVLGVMQAVSGQTDEHHYSNGHGHRKGSRQALIDRLLEDHDPRIPPNYEEEFPVMVEVQLHISNIDSISESTMDYSMGMFIRQSWVDKRLEYTPLPRIRSLELDSKLMNSIWVPDLYITNEKSASFHMVTVPNKLMHIYPDGRVQYSIRVSATIKCNMDLRKYPLDKQTCSIIMESFGYSTETVVFVWNEDPVQRAKRMTLPKFQLGAMVALKCDKEYVGVNYTCLSLEFDIVRSVGYYITQLYIPSMMIVCLSWLSFWLDIDAVPARISLGLLTVLTMTTQSSGARASLPKVSYVKGIDVWMATCLFFVFAALIEFAYVNVLSRIEKRKLNTVQNLDPSDPTKDPDDPQGPCTVEPKKFSILTPNRENARNLDKLSRALFPAVFFLFNLVYWCVYLFWEPDKSDLV